MTLVRASALREQGQRNAELLEQVEQDPPRYLNAVYLSVMFAQNGSAILVAILSERHFGEVGVTLVSIVFTLAYFVVVEAMSKTFAILHSDRVALALAPLVWFLGRALSLPTRGLIGLANILLPGKGLKEGPFAFGADIRSLTELGHREGAIEAHEKKIIDSALQLGARSVREVMVPRPDIVAIEVGNPLSALSDLIVRRGLTRIPVYCGDLDHIEGIVHAKDVLDVLRQDRRNASINELLRPARFIPETKLLAELLHDMQADQFHIAIVSDEYGSVSGVVTLEDLLEELVGKINDEYDHEVSELTPLGDGRYRVIAALPISELNEHLGTSLPHEAWNTVGGLMFGLLGAIPAEGESVELEGCRFTAEKVHGRRIATVLIERLPDEQD